MAQATKIPEFVLHTGKTLVDNGFEAYLVGGCVRDVFFLNREPEDWDLATNATPEQMMQLFPNSVYENTFGTVIVKTIQDADTVETQEMGRRLHKHNIEITTFRTESAYSDKRHPDSIQFAKTIQEDVSRRDFTFDAFAVPFVMKKNEVGLGDILDLFGGIADVKKKIIRAVGKPDERFSEDALRLVRAVRFATELGFAIEKDTLIYKSTSKSGGENPCFVAVNHKNQVLVANYSGGNVGFLALNADGELSDLLFVQQHFGKGTTSRQEAPHAHSAWFHPKTNDVISVDLGTNQLWFSKIDARNKELVFTNQKTLNMAEAAGPRHLVFHPNKNWMYVLNELNNTISLVTNNNGNYSIKTTVSTLPKGYEKYTKAADIRVSNDGKFLYASNRGHNSIAIFKVNLQNGDLVLVGFEPVKGANPRNFSLTLDDKFLLVANQDSNNIVSFKRDVETGKLSFVNEIQAPNPVCILF